MGRLSAPQITSFFGKIQRQLSKGTSSVSINQQSINWRILDGYLQTIAYRYEATQQALNRIRGKALRDDRSLLRRIRSGKLIPPTQPVTFLKEIDYFLFAVKSCLDTIGHVLNLVYAIQIPPDRVDFFRVLYSFPDKRSSFYTILDGHKKRWIDDFNIYRRFITHHKLMTTVQQLSTGKGYHAHVLPDNPFTVPRRGKKGRYLPKYFGDVHAELRSIIIELFKDLDKKTP